MNDKLKNNDYDFALLDAEVNRIVWTFANLFPGCLMKSIDGIRQKKKFFWDTMKNDHRYWLATNMMGEAFLGFGAFNTKKITGKDTIDFIKNRQLVAKGALVDEKFMEQVMGKPEGKVTRFIQKGGAPFFYCQASRPDETPFWLIAHRR